MAKRTSTNGVQDVINTGSRFTPLRVKEGVLVGKRGEKDTRHVAINVQGGNMQTQGTPDLFGIYRTKQNLTKEITTNVAQDMINTGSRLASLRMEEGASFMESGEEETSHAVNIVNAGNVANGGTHVINGRTQSKQVKSVATVNGPPIATNTADIQFDARKELPATEVSVGLKNKIEQLKVVSIMADHVVEILSQETVGGSDKHMAVMLSERKQTKQDSVGGKIVKARIWADRTSDEGYRKGFHLWKQAVVKSRPQSAVLEWAQSLSNQLESHAVNGGNVDEEVNVAHANTNESTLTKGVVVVDAPDPLELTSFAVGKVPLELLEH
ncbi:hypothetical protein V6N13_135148 [Hibiscus sabdariffa]